MQKNTDFEMPYSSAQPMTYSGNAMSGIDERETNISLRDFMEIVRRRRNIILQAFAVILGVGLVITFFTTPVYRTTAFLLIPTRPLTINSINGTDPLGILLSQSPTLKLETQVRLLTSQDTLSKVATQLRGPLPSLSARSVKDTDIIEITAEGPNPKVIADAANILLNVYLEDSTEANGGQVKSALDFVEKGANKAQKELEQTEAKLKDFKLRYRVGELDESLKAQSGQIQKLKDRYAELQTKILVTNSQIAAVKKQMDRESPTEAQSAANDPLVQATEAKIAGLEDDRSILLLRYTPANQKVASLDAQLAVLKARLAKQRAAVALSAKAKNPLYEQLRTNQRQLDVDASTAATEAAAISRQLTEAYKQLSNFPSWELELARLQRQMDISKANYTLFAAKREDLRLRAQALRIDARIMEKAGVPSVPIRPNRLQNILVAILLGLGVGVMLALLQEYLDDRINSVNEADRILQLPNLGMIPLIEESGLRQLWKSKSFSPITEAYRALRTNLNFASVDNPIRTLMLTSTGPAEGKSLSAANLATAMAMDGKRVILVDADLRRPTAHKLFNLNLKPGLTDVLIGTHSLSQVLQETEVANVQVITAGTQAPNPAELIGSEAMAHFVDTIRDVADFIIFDSPPAVLVSDAIVLSARVDGVLFVVSYGETKKGSSVQALTLLRRARANILGTVVNKLDARGRGYYGKYYYNYGYGYGYGYGYAPITDEASSTAAAETVATIAQNSAGADSSLPEVPSGTNSVPREEGM